VSKKSSAEEEEESHWKSGGDRRCRGEEKWSEFGRDED
jgi:hypothetical protein